MVSKPCKGCGEPFRPRPQCPNQSYCTKPGCQRERRRRWQQSKRATDSDYDDNQKRAQRAWNERHPEYWRGYRAGHPEYEERNRQQQQPRNARRGQGMIAKMDASTPVFPVPSGTYRLTPAGQAVIAKSDAWTVEITVLSKS